MINFENFNQPKDVIKSTGSGYKGLGFKYHLNEWQEKMRALMKQGMTEEEAVVKLTQEEAIVRARQQDARRAA